MENVSSRCLLSLVFAVLQTANLVRREILLHDDIPLTPRKHAVNRFYTPKLIDFPVASDCTVDAYNQATSAVDSKTARLTTTTVKKLLEEYKNDNDRMTFIDNIIDFAEQKIIGCLKIYLQFLDFL